MSALTGPPAPRAFWEQFGSHTGKLSHAESAALVGSGQVISSAAVFNGRVHEASRTSHNRKLRGLYVDYADGLVLVPTAIDNATAQRRIELAETLVDRARQGFSARVEQVKWWANKSIALRVVWVIFLTWATENQLGDVMQMLATGRSDGLMELFPRFAAYVEPTCDLTTFLNNYARATDS